MRGLRKLYRPSGFGGAATLAVAGVDLEVLPDEVVGLIGESGCGKTSLVRAALGLVPRDGGDVRVLGKDPARLGASDRAALRRRGSRRRDRPGGSW